MCKQHQVANWIKQYRYIQVITKYIDLLWVNKHSIHNTWTFFYIPLQFPLSFLISKADFEAFRKAKLGIFENLFKILDRSLPEGTEETKISSQVVLLDLLINQKVAQNICLQQHCY